MEKDAHEGRGTPAADGQSNIETHYVNDSVETSSRQPSLNEDVDCRTLKIRFDPSQAYMSSPLIFLLVQREEKIEGIT